MAQLSLATPIDQVLMIGPTYTQRLKKLNIYTIKDLIHHYPNRYQDFSQITPINKLKTAGEQVSIQGQIISCRNVRTKFGQIQTCFLKDQTASIKAVWFNQAYLPKSLKPGLRLNLSGKTSFKGKVLCLVSPQYELINNRRSPLHTGRLVPIYPQTAHISSKWLRARIAFVLKNLNIELKKDWLPQALKNKYQLIDLGAALKQIHFPTSWSHLKQAQTRLSFDELLLLQLQSFSRKKTWDNRLLNHRFQPYPDSIQALVRQLPFNLTSSQLVCLKEILNDLVCPRPMNRLLQGDVGSGKTIIAALAIYLSFLNHHQSIFMAPTEILANQHFQTLKTIFQNTPISLSLITASTKSKHQNLQADILVGTHALLFKQLRLKRLGLLVIDEQHRFGVQQRIQLLQASPSVPHLLTLTATPIPRTVALTVLADLKLSTLDQLPPGRLKVKTWLVPKNKRLSAYDWIKKQIKRLKIQAFVVCPLIESSTSQQLQTLTDVTAEYKRLKSIFSDQLVEFLHGRLPTHVKHDIINRFRSKKIDLLVTTQIIEVGLDIKNATIIVIENADRFGLAQLHQLRGRVGRGDKQSYCLLFTQNQNPLALKRLRALETITSGRQLAELDLKLRGPGHLYGLKQHGFLNLKLASYQDKRLICLTTQAAQTILASPSSLLKKILKEGKIKPICLHYPKEKFLPEEKVNVEPLLN